MEPWTLTYTGERFFPFAPFDANIDIVDIAHALAMTVRFNRWAKDYYSVAQHSVLVAKHADPKDKLRALLHDAPEAYSPFGDVPRPVKAQPEAAFVVGMEKRIERAIALEFGLPYPIKNDAIDLIDSRILHDEAEVLMPTHRDWELPDVEPLGIEIEPWPWDIARVRFIDAFHKYQDWHHGLNGGAE